jgi:hypothetical protein
LSKRLDNLKKAMDNFVVDAEDYEEDVEEDLRPYLEPGAEISQFMAITHHEGKFFLYPCFHSLDGAVGRIEEYAADDIYVEVPVGVIDLDSGDFFSVLRVHVDIDRVSKWNLNEVRT